MPLFEKPLRDDRGLRYGRLGILGAVFIAVGIWSLMIGAWIAGALAMPVGVVVCLINVSRLRRSRGLDRVFEVEPRGSAPGMGT